jgi:sigma-B regulation protein RsbU (phosphoserine phosphatase)
MGIKDDTSTLSAASLERVLSVTRALARPLELGAMLQEVVDAARSVLQADRGTVFLYEKATHELVSKVATGSGELRVPADRGIVGECARTRQAVTVPDCYADPRFNQDVDKLTGYRTRCLMTVPLIGHDDSLEGVLQVLNKHEGVFTEEDEQIATALAAQCAVALQRTRLLEDLVHKERLEQELSLARQIQQRVFPRVMPKIPGYDVAGWCRTADQTGGDIFDLIHLENGRLILLLGDATGHGIGPALSVTQVRAMLRMCIRFSADITAAFGNINDQLSEDLASNRFVTAFLGELDTERHRVLFHSGGQGPLLHWRVTGEPDWRAPTTLPLGILGGAAVAEPCVIDLASGDILALVTDGIFEYENLQGDPYGEDRLVEVIRAGHDLPVVGLIDRIVADVEAFAGGAPQADDLTIVLLRRLSD